MQCLVCQDTGVINPPLPHRPGPCPVCKAKMLIEAGPVALDEVMSVPFMVTIPHGVSVRQPDGQMRPPVHGPAGGVSVGASHLETVGPVLNIAFHEPGGVTLVATFGGHAFAQLGQLINDAALRIQAGEFDAPEQAG